jgi:putative CocE/NonD family hydrolase
VKTFGGANLTFERGPEDQRQVGERADYLRFATPVLSQAVAITGPVSAELWVATDGPDTDFMAKLVDVYPDGYEALVLDAPVRLRYRNGRMKASDVKMMTPGKPEKVTIDLWATSLLFEKGHRIALHVTSSNNPRFDVNDNSGTPPGEPAKPRVARNTVFFDAAHPSSVVLPVTTP